MKLQEKNLGQFGLVFYLDLIGSLSFANSGDCLSDRLLIGREWNIVGQI